MITSGRGLSLSLTRARRRRGSAPFHPTQIAQVAAGYFWDPSVASGSGTAGFLLPEGNGKSTHDIITPASDTAPSISTVNGEAVVLYANGTPDRIARTVAAQRGFTSSAAIGGWIGASVRPGTIAHGRDTTVMFAIQFTGSDVRVIVHDGASAKESRFPLPPGGYTAGPFFYWAAFDASQATATNRIQLSYDGVAQVPNVTGSPGTSMTDAAEVLCFGAGTAADASSSNIAADWSHGCMYLTNGIPSAADMLRIMAFKPLK